MMQILFQGNSVWGTKNLNVNKPSDGSGVTGMIGQDLRPGFRIVAE